jgi:hypothetical protein
MAKNVVEQNFGTNHAMFGQFVELIQAANVNLKTQNYTGRQSLFGKPASSMRVTQQEKQKKKKSPEREIVG